MATLKGTFIIEDYIPLFDLAEKRGIPNAKEYYMYMYSKEETGRVKHLFKHIVTRSYQMVSDEMGTTKKSYRRITTWKD